MTIPHSDIYIYIYIYISAGPPGATRLRGLSGNLVPR
jgi:hypothetical protein